MYIHDRERGSTWIVSSLAKSEALGLAVFAAGYPRTQDEACATGAPLDAVEQTATPGASSLEYDPATKQYTYVWKTPSFSRSRTCRELQMKLVDGTLHVADFKAK